MSANGKDSNIEAQRALRHDIKNQLSNIYLALEALRYDLPDPTDDCKFYMDSIADSASKINTLVTEIE